MNDDRTNSRLSQIATGWTTLNAAHGAASEVASEAQRRILQRYGGAVYRYLLAATRNEDLADELFQEFALRFVRGDFRRADPGRGRFREFLKTTLFHLAVDVQRRRQRQPQPLPADLVEAVDQRLTGSEEGEQQFRDLWREQLLTRAWAELENIEAATARPVYKVLSYRARHPDLTSEELAHRLSEPMGKKLSAAWVRKWLLQGRLEFATQLIEAVRESLGQATRDELEQEILDLGLMEYCRPAWSAGTTPGAR